MSGDQQPSMVLVPSRGFPSLHLTLNFLDGSGGDALGKAGLSCLTNRMLLRGTLRRSRQEMEEAIEQLGTELITWSRRDATCLSAAVLSRHLDRFLGLVGEVLSQPAFEEEEFEKVRREMLAELDSLKDDDAQLARSWLRRSIYGDHPFGNDPAGTTEGLKSIYLEDVKACHHALYRRDRLLIGASGDFDVPAFEQTLERMAATLPIQGIGRTIPPIPADDLDAPRGILVDKPGRTQIQLLVAQRMPPASDPDFMALKLAISAFGGNFTSRLMQELRVKRGLTYGVHAWLGGDRHAGMLMMGGSADAQRGIEALTVLLSEYERFIDEGLTDEELEFIRQHHLKSLPFSTETASLQAAQRIRQHLEGRAGYTLAALQERLRSITTDEIRSAVRRHCRRSALKLVVVGTDDGALYQGLQGLTGGTGVSKRDYRDPL